MSLNILTTIYGLKGRVSLILRSGLGQLTVRFQILRTRLPEGYKRVNGRPTKNLKRQPDQLVYFRLEAWVRFSKQHVEMKLQIGQKKVPNCKQHAVK